MLAVVLLGLLATSPDVVLHSEPSPAAPIVARSIPKDAMRPIHNTQMGAAVYTIRGEWYYVAIGAQQKAWLQKTPQMVFHLYLDLVTRNVPVLASRWDGRIYGVLGHHPSTSAPLQRVMHSGRSVAVKILANRRYKGGLWFQIETPVADHCGALPPNVRPTKGWIPAYTPEGEPNLWFASDGC
ncbi:MAG TPA: hypothetical protein VGK29_26965 [Paludibaculum sp.]